jgi:hypothetical protein
MGESFINMSESNLYWTNPDWQKQAHDWIRAEAGRQSIHITGAIEQFHMYPWSTVLRVPTSEGALFFKATAAETVYEAALTQKLAGWVPDCMPELVAVDPARGWMLMCDGGEQLRASIRPTRDLSPWNPVITRYAEVQIGLANHFSRCLLGFPDHRLAHCRLYAIAQKEESLLIDHEKDGSGE